MIVFWLFLSIILFCVYILFGLHITKDAEGISQRILIWVIYTILWGTFINIFTLGYFWSVIREKAGPYGLRGPEGETGGEGIKGECSITASQAYCMKSINDYINNLYKIETNKNILNEETQKFPCTYLNEKIQKMAGSRQYQVIIANLSNENKNIENIINYLKSIWKEWFDLIYNATNPQGKWFEDKYGDENYEWVGNNPFDEIKKYDIYYWGITRDFRPLKAELCRSSLTYENSKFPKHNYPEEKPPRLRIIETNDYHFNGSDDGSGAYYDASWYRPNPAQYGGETYYPVGDVVVRDTWNAQKSGDTEVGDLKWKSQDNGPDIKTILVAGDVKDPINYDDTLIWHDHDWWFGSYKMKCPEDYIDMGNIVRSHRMERYYRNINYDGLKCIPKECVEPLNKSGDGVWENWENWQFAINTSDKINPNNTNGYNLFRTDNSKQPFYKIKDKCLKSTKVEKPPPPSTKEVEKEFGDLGIGWQGHPYKLDPKYSIFSFLNLVPEGMIVHKGTGQRYYIIHYGGEDINIFNILTYNKQTNKYDYALQINSNYKESFKDNKENNNKINNNKELFKDNKIKNNNQNTKDKYIFLISNKNGKYISYDNKTNKLLLNKGKALIFEIKDINEKEDNYCNILKSYYIDNNKKNNITNNNNNTMLSTINNNNIKWKFIDNKDGTIKIYNNNNKYLDYNKIKDEVELIDNNKNVYNWILNKL
jgi:hypothetical protein